MTTWAKLTIGYFDFVLPASKAQMVFETLQGGGINSNFLYEEIAQEYGITRGERFEEMSHKIACSLLSDTELHLAWERERIHKLYKEREILDSELAKEFSDANSEAA